MCVRWVMLVLMCLVFAGPHGFQVPLVSEDEPKAQTTRATPPPFWDRTEAQINGWMKRNLPDFVYAWAPRLLAPTFDPLASLYRWSRMTTQDPQTGWIEHHLAHGVLWMFYHPWISGLVGLLLVLRGRRWMVWPVRRLLFRR